MFRKRFAYQFSGYGGEQGVPPWLHHREHQAGFFGMHRDDRPFGPDQGRGEGDWSPPWLQEEWQRPHFFGMHRGRGSFGPGGPFGHGGPFGSGGEGGRFFGRGDVKFALLELLRERPMHGYEMMKALEEKSGGFYRPSPGSVYPTLQMLEDGGLVTSNEVEGKKVYSITDAGRASLAERQRNQEGPAGPPWMRRHDYSGYGQRPEMKALRSEIEETARLATIAGRMSLQDPEKLARFRGIIDHTRKELTNLIYGDGSSEQESTQNAP